MKSHARRLKLGLAVACGCALLVSGVASALGGFLDGKPDWFELACNETACTFWLVLDEGKADQVSVNVGDPEFSGAPRWNLRMPASRYLSANRKDTGPRLRAKGASELPLSRWPSRSVLCDAYVDALHLRLGDLNDTFAANGTELTVPMHILGEDGSDYLRSARGKDYLSRRERQRRPPKRSRHRQPLRRSRQRHPGRRRWLRRHDLRRRERHRPVSGPQLRPERRRSTTPPTTARPGRTTSSGRAARTSRSGTAPTRSSAPPTQTSSTGTTGTTASRVAAAATGSTAATARTRSSAKPATTS